MPNIIKTHKKINVDTEYNIDATAYKLSEFQRVFDYLAVAFSSLELLSYEMPTRTVNVDNIRKTIEIRVINRWTIFLQDYILCVDDSVTLHVGSRKIIDWNIKGAHPLNRMKDHLVDS